MPHHRRLVLTTPTSSTRTHAGKSLTLPLTSPITHTIIRPLAILRPPRMSHHPKNKWVEEASRARRGRLVVPD
jgi:hypothetical protein